MGNNKYSVIYLDPPWKYNSRANHKTRFRGGAEGHYNLMTMKEIQALPIPDMAADNCAMFMWCTFPYLEDQIKLFSHWGFNYKTVGFTWVKLNPVNKKPFFGVGYYAKSNAEVCLLGIKGKMKPVSNKVSSIIIAPRREHSRKPDEARDRIVELFGDVKRIELFARQKSPGWDVWGNDTEKFKGGKMKSILSLFDGMSCGQIALNKAGIKYKNYYASEVDKYAMAVTMANYPKTVQVGDITKVKAEDLPKIDLLMGGSPCQGFSVAGKGLNFDDPRSKLFFEFVRLLKECKPKYFLLENVKMKKEHEDAITKLMGVDPILINSADFSAQNRKRLYWTNIPIKPWKDKGILLKDIVEFGEVDREKSYCIDACYFKAGNGPGSLRNYIEKKRRQIVFKNKSQTIPSTIYKENVKSMLKRKKYGLIVADGGIRKLTPLECERLQTVPEGYTDAVSNTQRYKMLGNGWTVDVVAHILDGIK